MVGVVVAGVVVVGVAGTLPRFRSSGISVPNIISPDGRTALARCFLVAAVILCFS